MIKAKSAPRHVRPGIAGDLIGKRIACAVEVRRARVLARAVGTRQADQNIIDAIAIDFPPRPRLPRPPGAVARKSAPAPPSGKDFSTLPPKADLALRVRIGAIGRKGLFAVPASAR